jgi:hypothetical protein
MEKSGEHVIPYQLRTPALVQEDHALPPSTETCILPFQTVAASLLKSREDAKNRQVRLPALVLLAQVTPLSLDMYIEPSIVAAKERKSGEAVKPHQSPLSGLEITTTLDGYDPAGTSTHAEFPNALL